MSDKIPAGDRRILSGTEVIKKSKRIFANRFAALTIRKTGDDTLAEQYLLEMKNIHKRFPGVHALKGVSLQLKAGEVHALLGENGAGKSTLIKVLGGIYEKDEGELAINGKPVEIKNVEQARAAGVSIIHQELVLVPYLSVTENIFLGRELKK